MATYKLTKNKRITGIYTPLDRNVSGGLSYTDMGNGLYLGRASGLHSAADQNQYTNYSSALGRTYNVGEYVPYYHNSYNTSSAAGKMQMEADRAAAENVRRYYEILSGYQQMLNNGVSSVGSAYNKALAANLQNLTSRGLTGTTILTNANTRNAVNATNAMANQYNTNLMNMLNFMERRNTTGA